MTQNFKDHFTLAFILLRPQLRTKQHTHNICLLIKRTRLYNQRNVLTTLQKHLLENLISAVSARVDNSKERMRHKNAFPSLFEKANAVGINALGDITKLGHTSGTQSF